MHPRFQPDMTRKDQFGFILMDKFVNVIGELSDDKGWLRSIYGSNLINPYFLVHFEPLPGIRSFHTIQFNGNPDRANVCISPAIYFDENTQYKWKDVKIPTVKNLNEPGARKKRDKKVQALKNDTQPKKRKSVP